MNIKFLLYICIHPELLQFFAAQRLLGKFSFWCAWVLLVCAINVLGETCAAEEQFIICPTHPHGRGSGTHRLQRRCCSHCSKHHWHRNQEIEHRSQVWFGSGLHCTCCCSYTSTCWQDHCRFLHTDSHQGWLHTHLMEYINNILWHITWPTQTSINSEVLDSSVKKRKTNESICNFWSSIYPWWPSFTR